MKYRVVTTHLVTNHYIVEADNKKDAMWQVEYGYDLDEKFNYKPIESFPDEERVFMAIQESEWGN